MLIENVFLDQTFQLYKANGAPAESFIYSEEETEQEDGFSAFLDNFAKFLYNYHSRTNPALLQSSSELISSINDYRDLLRQLKVTKGRETSEKGQDEPANAPSHQMIFFSIRHVNPRILQKQSVVFITKTDDDDKKTNTSNGDRFSTIVLVKVSNPSILEGLLAVLEQTVQLEYPLVIKPERISQYYIKDTIDKMSEEKSVQEFGDVELNFQTSEVVGDSLRQMSVSIPQADLQRFYEQIKQARREEQGPQSEERVEEEEGGGEDRHFAAPVATRSLVAAIFSHLQKITALNLELVLLSRFTSQIVNISQDGRIKIHRRIDQEDHLGSLDNVERVFSQSLVWRLLISLFNK